MDKSTDAEGVHGGNKAIKLTGTGTAPATETWNAFDANINGSWVVSQTAGSITEISGWIRVKSLSEGSYVRIRTFKGTVSSTRIDKNSKITAAGDWQQFCYPYTDTTATYAVGWIEICLFGTGEVYVDDVTISDSTSILPSTFWGTYNWISTTGRVNATTLSASSDNFGTKVTTGFDGESDYASLYLGTTETYKNPVIYYTFATRNKPVTGENYRFSFRFKPAEDGAKPLAYLASTAASSGKTYIKNQLATFNPGYTLIEGDNQNGWQEYHGYFTMPETTTVVFCLRGSEGNNGYYNAFSLEKDYEEDVKVVNSADTEVKTAEVGETVSLQAHVISEIAEAGGGEKVTLLVAAYNGQGILKCVDVACKTETIYAGKEYTAEEVGTSVGNVAQDVTYKFVTAAKDITFDYIVPESAAGCTLKAFCWNGGSLKPMGSSYKVTVAAK